MKTESFNYLLPSSLIAQTPIEPRHDSRMLVYDRAADEITENIFKNIKEYLYPGDVMVINKTKVIPARIFGRKITGGKVEVLLIKKLDDLSWEVLIGGKHVKKGAELLFECGLSCALTVNDIRGH